MRKFSRTKLFFGTAIPFGVAVAMFRIGQLSLPYLLALGAISGALLGGAITWWANRSSHRLTVERIGPGGRQPTQERSVEVRGDVNTVHDACRRSLLKLPKLTLVKDSQVTGELDARTGASWNGFGESISVRITGDGPNATVHISTEPRLGIPAADHGHEAESVALFLRYLLSEIPEAVSEHRRVVH